MTRPAFPTTASGTSGLSYPRSHPLVGGTDWSGGSPARSKSKNGHRIAKELGITAGGEGGHTAPTNPKAHPKTKVQAPIHKTQRMTGNKAKEARTTGARRGAVTPRMSDPKIIIPTPKMEGMDIMGGRITRTEMVMDHEAKED